MTNERKHLARTLFQLKVLKAEGFAFEQLFGQVMEYSRPEFLKIKPYGNQGDRGNDGYEKALGRYFQVFAPESPTTSKSAAIAKVAEDFEDKLLPYWGTFCVPREYIFVFNDKYHGTNFNIEETLAGIKTKHNLEACDVFLSKHLEQEFICLPEDQICMIVGGLPTWDSMEGLDYTVLGEVIRHIQDCPPENAPTGKKIAPDFDEKIEFNELAEYGPWLRVKQRETWQIDDYLSRNSDFTKQALRDFLAGYYAESLAAVQSDQSGAGVTLGDLRFAFVLNRIAPQSNNAAADRLRRDAALVLMAKYFEACDIFEEPNNVTS
ncbi:hypothetical protein GCT19_15320 [Paraburkholderia sp. CNPSo 3155]|uniref:ABC-three component system protein n=1 Tax=Paraburkholderia atlantica TaxID=2654982 RepID=UPI00128D75AF|nr:ABC-three component system protein [Paraburkholderia atlantica]MPW07007.1 hypothetical protein [Paraburkholderia atlantica]